MIEIKNVSKIFTTKEGNVKALDNVSITIPDGDIYGIIGMSGAGKSTLVRCINVLERVSRGQILLDGKRIDNLSEKNLRSIRRDITMIFQGFNLLLQRNCLKNVSFPLELAGVKKAEARKKARELLEIVGLKDKEKAYPSQLSGGQQQRVAIARALAYNPKVLLCDEATSALDPNTTNSILELIQDINKKLGITVIIITHQMNVVEKVCNHVAILDHGKVVESGEVSKVFVSPKTKTAKNLVFPELNSDTPFVRAENEKVIRVVFNGAVATGLPMIAKLAIEKGIEANILYASTKGIGDRAYGSMLLGVRDIDDNIKKAKEYLTSIPDIAVMEVEIDD